MDIEVLIWIIKVWLTSWYG